ncbi:MAG: chemotaxis protein CheW [Chloroflexota bacterium]
MSGDLLVFDVADQHYGLPVREVREVLPRASLTPLPGSPPGLIGLLRLRGALLPVVDLRQCLGLAATSPRIGQCIVVTSLDVADVGFLVDAARGIVPGGLGASSGAERPGRGQILREVAMTSGEVVAVLDARAALGAELEGFLPAGLIKDIRAPDDVGETLNRPEDG